jgi:hypothetical protein
MNYTSATFGLSIAGEWSLASELLSFRLFAARHLHLLIMHYLQNLLLHSYTVNDCGKWLNQVSILTFSANLLLADHWFSSLGWKRTTLRRHLLLPRDDDQPLRGRR